jgi:hypothetical protein
VPLLLEAKMGDNWLDTKDVAWYNYGTYINRKEDKWQK